MVAKGDNTRVKRSYSEYEGKLNDLHRMSNERVNYVVQIRFKFVGSSTCTSDMPHQRACLPGWKFQQVLADN